jgi:formyl-CoA transferase
MTKPLEGLLVVSLEQAVAAPMASRRLADAGARVIKLERPEGDFARGYDKTVNGQSSYFVWLNRGKQSVVTDLSRAEDRALFETLLSRADVFIQNLKPGSLARLGYGTESLTARYPRLITCSITGYGDTGPYADRKAYDLLIQAESGLASVTGGPEGPARVGVSIVDVGTGMTAYEAILEALIARGRTGRGADIRVSMFDCMAELMTVPLLQGENGLIPKRSGLSHVSISPYGVFDTADGVPILISIQSDREWATFCKKVLCDPAPITDERFATNTDRVRNRPVTDGMVAAWFASRDHNTAIDVLTAAEIAFAKVNDVSGLSTHPHLRRVTVAAPGGEASMPAPGAQLHEEANPQFGPVPVVGADTDAVRREFLR